MATSVPSLHFSLPRPPYFWVRRAHLLRRRLLGHWLPGRWPPLPPANDTWGHQPLRPPQDPHPVHGESNN